jgi:hypothetical protein
VDLGAVFARHHFSSVSSLARLRTARGG